MDKLLNLSNLSAHKNGPALIISPTAIQKMKEFQEKLPEAKEKYLRVYVYSGGCSGYKYNFKFDQQKSDDITLEIEGATCVVDPKSASLLMGSTLDYHEGLTGAGFIIKNPNATETCGCGKSFGL